ncbi:MAG: alanine racemase, partial [Clostridia bacterium]|nr:alanine racemase [Clostridia bacterium]
MLMLKADAYGHGMLEVANATDGIVDAFGVATLEEGLKLRRNGIENDILVLALAPSELYCAVKNGLTIGLANVIQLDMLERLIAADVIGAKEIKLHIALDSGMHRLGFIESQLNIALAKLKELGIEVEGVYSHLRVRSYKQIYAFERMSAAVCKQYPDAIKHLAASHTACVKRIRYDMVRAGIHAYAGAMRVESNVIAVRRVDKGEHISYGDYVIKKPTNTAVVFGGYADGVCRERPSSVYIRGVECK